MKKTEKFSFWAATWFKTGLIPPVLLKSMAGTYGSIAAIPLCLLGIYIGNGWVYFFLCYIICYIGLFTVPPAERILKERTDWRGNKRNRDQPQIVIDEVLGMLVACFPLLFAPEVHWYHYGIALGLFRFFDIKKIWPAGYFEEKVEDEFGVMYDDFFAGLHSAIVLQFILWAIPNPHLAVVGMQLIALIAYAVGSRRYYLGKGKCAPWFGAGIAIDLIVMGIGFSGILPHGNVPGGAPWSSISFLTHIVLATGGMLGFMTVFAFLLVGKKAAYECGWLRTLQYRVFLPSWIAGVLIAFLNLAFRMFWGFRIYDRI